MILVRSPLRITLGGGGTDLEPYCSEHGGFCIAAAIDKYVYVSITKPFTPGIYLKYSEIEHVETVDAVKHPVIRRALELFDIEPQIEITTLADIPAGTGLGSSSSFTTALLAALCAFTRQYLTTKQLADAAIGIEKQIGPTGRQDQYAAAYGGLSVLRFDQDSSVRLRLDLSAGAEQQLNDRLLLFYTGVTHETGYVLVGQGDAITNLDGAKRIGLTMRDILVHQQWYQIGTWFNWQWKLKEIRCAAHPAVTTMRQLALDGGANGAKLIGAGQGGFLLCDTDQPARLRKAMSAYQEVRYRWDYEGTKTLLS